MAISIDILNREGDDIINDIKSRLASTGANATGKTSDSLEKFASEERLIVSGGKSFGINKRDQRGFVEAGRGAGGVPPFQAIQEWAIARGIVSGDSKEDRKIINGIRWKIARIGTQIWRGDASPRLIYLDVITDDRVDGIINQIQGRYADKILSDIVQQFKK